jgi:hypothetical protein
MYSSPYLTSWMGAAQCAGAMATGEWHSNPKPHADSEAQSNSNSET